MNALRVTLAAALLCTSGAALAKQYTYYPSYQIYFEPTAHTWYWRDTSGVWKSGETLPAYLEQFTTNGVMLELATDQPYTQHATVTARYGKNQAPISPKNRTAD
ncbi:MAG TPA: hypothetical protein VJM11_11420 [Nevskiaceae bacterium]|nr:hypothetical protein [Nevskiaceae bacterium]